VKLTTMEPLLKSVPNVEPSEMAAVSQQPSVHFVFPTMEDNDWRTDTSFNSMGMQCLYWISNMTLHWIFPSNRDHYIHYAKNYEDFLNVSSIDVNSLIIENKGPLSVVVVSLLVGVLLTFFGLCWCLAKLCCGDESNSRGGCCSSSKRHHEEFLASRFEEKGDKWRRLFCGVIFSTVIVLFM